MSTLAVFGLLGGGAFAAAKIGPKDIAKNAVRSKHIKAGAVKARHLAPGLLPGPPGAQGQPGAPGPQGEPATRLFAFVESNGTLMHGIGATGATSKVKGRYVVTFNRSMEGCVANANAYREDLSQGFSLSFHIAIRREPTNANALGLEIWNSSLTENYSLPFALTVFCP